MEKLSQERAGETFVISSALLWSLFPIVTKLSYRGIEPITSLAWTTLLSMLFFAAVSSVRGSWTNVLRKEILLNLVGVAVAVGIIFYTLYFLGLKHTSAGNAGIIATFETFFSFLFFNLWKKEHMSGKHILGAIFMLVCVGVILSPNLRHIQVGDFFILAAVIVSPFANHFTRTLRTKMVKSDQILFYRTLISAPALFLIAYLLGEKVTVPASTTWLTIGVNGMLLFGLSKLFWAESIFRINVTKAVALQTIAPILTLLFAFWILGDQPTLTQLTAMPLALLGVYFLTRPV